MPFTPNETQLNLMRAFAGESQARNRYTIAAGCAKEKNLYVLEEVFLYTADQERAHAAVFYDLLQEAAGQTLQIDGGFPVDIDPALTKILQAAQHNELRKQMMYIRLSQHRRTGTATPARPPYSGKLPKLKPCTPNGSASLKSGLPGMSCLPTATQAVYGCARTADICTPGKKRRGSVRYVSMRRGIFSGRKCPHTQAAVCSGSRCRCKPETHTKNRNTVRQYPAVLFVLGKRKRRSFLSEKPPSVQCGRRDLNPYGEIHTPLKRARLPVPPLPHGDISVTDGIIA